MPDEVQENIPENEEVEIPQNVVVDPVMLDFSRSLLTKAEIEAWQNNTALLEEQNRNLEYMLKQQMEFTKQTQQFSRDYTMLVHKAFSDTKNELETKIKELERRLEDAAK